MALPAGYSAMNIKTETRDVMRQLMFRLSSETGKRVSISDTIAVACKIATQHIDETIAEVTK